MRHVHWIGRVRREGGEKKFVNVRPDEAERFRSRNLRKCEENERVCDTKKKHRREEEKWGVFSCIIDPALERGREKKKALLFSPFLFSLLLSHTRKLHPQKSRLSNGQPTRCAFFFF